MSLIEGLKAWSILISLRSVFKLIQIIACSNSQAQYGFDIETVKLIVGL
jgi:hypothetical protein